jgi:hypothetical protein
VIDAAALHRAADRIAEASSEMDQLAAAGAQFIAETDLWAVGPDPTELVELDRQSLGYGIMLGYLAAQEAL